MITYSFTVCVAGNANAVPLVADVVDCVPRGKCTLGITELGQTGVYTVSVTVVTDCGDCKTLTVPQPRSWPGSWLLTLILVLRANRFAYGGSIGPAESGAAVARVCCELLICDRAVRNVGVQQRRLQ